MIFFLTEGRTPASGMAEYLDHSGQSLANRIRVLHYEDLPQCTAFARGTYIISAFDQLTGAGRVVVRTVTEALGREPGIRIVNPPQRTLTRYQLLSTLHQLGRNSFRAVRADEDIGGLRYPVFLRSEWQHTGAWSPLLHSPAEVERAIGGLVLRGHSFDELLVVEFCDTSDGRGMYRKYAAFVVGDQIIPRSLAYGSQWSLKHGSTAFTMALAVEERDYVLGNPHHEALREVFALAGIEYGRMDYAIRGDAIEVWEINLNPTIGRGRRPASGKVPAELEPIRQVGRDEFYRRFGAALAALDPGPAAGPPVVVQFDAAVRGIRMLQTGEAQLGLVRGVFEAFRPVLAPVARALSPVVGRLVRRRRH